MEPIDMNSDFSNLSLNIPVDDTVSASQISHGRVGDGSTTASRPSNAPQTANASSLQTYEDYLDFWNFFPLDTEEHRRLRIAMHSVMNSEWKRMNKLEPTSLDILQFSEKTTGSDGTPSFECLLYHDGQACGKRWSRTERLLAHLRGAIDLRPFACEGEGNLCNCGMRFFAEDTLQQHRKNSRTISCQYCSVAVTPRNIRKHYRANCPSYPAQAVSTYSYIVSEEQAPQSPT